MIGQLAVFGLAAAAGVAAAGAGGWRAAVGSTADYDRWAAGLRAWRAPPAEVAELVRLAALAPNGHNTQPWRFRVGDGRIEILPDLARRTPVVDPDDHHLWTSLGAAAETLAVAGVALGRPGEVEAEGEGIAYVHGAGAARPHPLAAAIGRRQTTRADYDCRPLAAEDAAALAAAAALPGVRIVLVTEPAAMGRLRDLVVAGNDVQMGDAAFMAELAAWIRFNPRTAMATGDGLYAGASGNPSIPTWLGRSILPRIMTPASEAARFARQMQTSAGCAVVFAEEAGPRGWIQVGRACQRFALAATTRDIRMSFVNQPVEVAALRPELAALAGEPGQRPDLLIRFGFGPLLPFSPRRPVADVLA
ncbi:Tat pathway signal protein [Amaricoccus sp.]|uniref:Acg family FMN-binding oxidoreductase n=1 Tax=Amaricoccus sp. TaxID=1872485 RepID=UPI001B4E2FF2|nr:Tat pathway signal protein [Amaricoccus sp.]MBP7241126.1 nitroreductase family protein [Amaricoccus sp.]